MNDPRVLKSQTSGGSITFGVHDGSDREFKKSRTPRSRREGDRNPKSKFHKEAMQNDPKYQAAAIYALQRNRSLPTRSNRKEELNLDISEIDIT